MASVLLTGGTGVLGRALQPRLPAAGHTVRIMSRRAAPANAPPGAPPGVEWAQAELTSGEGLAAAVAGVDTILHAASDAGGDVWRSDVEGTARLLAAARAAGVRHMLYVSIAGIDRVPYEYYRVKLAVEELVRNGGVPWTILRATQFHDLIDMILGGRARHALVLLPSDLKYQPIDPGDCADQFVRAVAAGPSGMLPAIGGPQVRTLDSLIRPWLAARSLRRLVIPFPFPGPYFAAVRRGGLLAPENPVGTIVWEQWLARRYGAAAAGRAVEPERERIA
jgi:uncharacterized protein YbjT (DUF2867 family)